MLKICTVDINLQTMKWGGGAGRGTDDIALTTDPSKFI